MIDTVVCHQHKDDITTLIGVVHMVKRIGPKTHHWEYGTVYNGLQTALC